MSSFKKKLNNSILSIILFFLIVFNLLFVGCIDNNSDDNNKIDMGIYSGLFSGGIGTSIGELDSPGEALLNGRMYMFSVFGDIMWVEYHFRVYHVLGDPSIHIWKDTPQSVIVNHPDTVVTGFSQVPVSVTYMGSGLPVANSQICISLNLDEI